MNPSTQHMYSAAEATSLRQHVDDPVNIWGGHGFVSANEPTPVYTVGRPRAQRLRLNLRKNGAARVPDYPLVDPVYMEYTDKHFFLPPAENTTYSTAGAPIKQPLKAGMTRSGGVCGKGVALGVGTPGRPYNGLMPLTLGVPPPSAPHSTPSARLGVSSGERINWVGSGCSAPAPMLGATAPAMTVQSEFDAFDTPLEAAALVRNPYLQSGTWMGMTVAGPPPAVHVTPYRRPVTVSGDAGFPIPLANAMKCPSVRF